MPSIFDTSQRNENACDDAHWHAICTRLTANPEDPDALFAYAAYLASWQKIAEAMKALKTLSDVSPDYPGLWRFKARLFKEMGESERALECLKLDNDPL